MTDAHHYIGCDISVESGRVVLGYLQGKKLTLEQINRFPNAPVRVMGSLRWNVLRIFEDLKAGLAEIASRQITPAGLSASAWGSDYVLVQRDQPVLGAPYHFSDSRTENIFAEALEHATPEVIYASTGLQFSPSNTLYQLLADAARNKGLLDQADHFLSIGDYFNYLFSGIACAEETIASTTQLFDPRNRQWSYELVHLYRLPQKVFPQIIPSGTVLGPLRDDVAEETGLEGVNVIVSCSYDTAAAVAGIPASGEDWAFLSCGTWSLLGVELRAPLIDATARDHNFANEAGYGGTTRFSKSLIGLWILRECRSVWQSEGEDYSFSDLRALADQAQPLRSLIHPNASRFWTPEEMPQKIQSYCEETDQPVPEQPGQIVRAIFESLAFFYRQVIEEIEEVTRRRIRTLHIIGSGCGNQLLNQCIADAIGRQVFAGPMEATAIGNVLIQAVAVGQLKSHEELREVVRQSFPQEAFRPFINNAWEAAYQRFNSLDLLT